MGFNADGTAYFLSEIEDLTVAPTSARDVPGAGDASLPKELPSLAHTTAEYQALLKARLNEGGELPIGGGGGEQLGGAEERVDIPLQDEPADPVREDPQDP
ncbi:hypothetical protein Dimus_001695 [Dionaea muscipula]